MLIYYLFKILRLWGIFALYTFIFSLFIMLTCNKIYKISGKKSIQLLIPIYNLIHLLDIVGLNRIYFILLLLPVVNVLVIYIILYRLSIVFHTTKYFALGLIFLPIIFLPILNYSKNLDNTKVEDIEKTEFKKDSYNMLTEQELNELNNTIDTTPKVDNVFKSIIKEEKEVIPFKANKIKYKEITLEEEKPTYIEKINPIKVEDLPKENKFISKEIDNNKDEDIIEIVEL